MKKCRSFRGTRELILQKYDKTTGSAQIATVYGSFTYSEVQRHFKDGFEIVENWDRCKQLNSDKPKGGAIDVRKVLKQAQNERQGRSRAVL